MRYDSTRASLCYLIITLLVGTVAGCSSKDAWKARTYQTTGTLKINGIAAEGAVVIFHPTAAPIDKRNSAPLGFVKSDGTFLMMTYEQNDGVPEGQYAVTIYWPAHVLPDAPDRLEGAYNDKDKPFMKVDIIRGINELAAIELKDVKVKPAAKL